MTIVLTPSKAARLEVGRHARNSSLDTDVVTMG